jgi:hypothetical protein
MEKIEQSLEESNVSSLFVYVTRSQATRCHYLRRMRIFFNHIDLVLIRYSCEYV